ncbi:MAG TPA: ABC transporter permease subunit [Kiloniellales bacterium]|nr:ABC transporter permease subunit [Kiloniellales bacterium]
MSEPALEGPRRPRRLPFWLSGRGLVTAVPYVWLLLFFLLPFAIVLKISLAVPVIAQPPFTPLFGPDGSLQATLDNYRFLLEDHLYLVAYLNSLKLAGISTLLCLLIGYPMAYGIARAPRATRNILLLLVILPFWTSFLLRVYAWMGILRNNGLINNLLMSLGIIDQPIRMMNTDFAIYIGITYSYLPFMILPLYAALERLSPDLVEAAQDLGCRPWKAFATITLPLSLPGIIAGCLLVFIPAVGEFIIPSLLGGPDSLMIGRVLWDEFFSNRDWPVASAVAIALLLLLVVPIMFFQRMNLRQARA